MDLFTQNKVNATTRLLPSCMVPSMKANAFVKGKVQPKMKILTLVSIQTCKTFIHFLINTMSGPIMFWTLIIWRKNLQNNIFRVQQKQIKSYRFGTHGVESKWSGKKRRLAEVLSAPAFERNPMESSPEDWLEVYWTGGDWQGLCRINVGSCNRHWRFKPRSVMSAPGTPSLTLKHSLLSGFYITKFFPTCTRSKRARGLHEYLC